MILSVHLMLQSRQLIESPPTQRGHGSLMFTPETAWAKLLRDGECYMWHDAGNIQELRSIYAGWVMEQGATVGETK